MSRPFSIVSDSYGIDPLKDRVSKALKNVTTYTQHIVTQDEIGHIGLLALKHYDDENLGYLILEYNAIGHELEMFAGQDLRIPSIASVQTNLRTTQQTTKIKRGVTI